MHCRPATTLLNIPYELQDYTWRPYRRQDVPALYHLMLAVDRAENRNLLLTLQDMETLLDGAIDDLESAMRVSRTIARAGLPFEYAVIGSSLLSRANKSIRAAACSPNMTEAGLVRLLGVLPTARELADSYKDSLKSDLYWFIKDELVRLREEEMREVHRILRGANVEKGRRRIRAAAQPYGPTPLSTL